jgi:hypothetical protein
MADGVSAEALTALRSAVEALLAAGGTDEQASGFAAALSGQILARPPTEFAQRGFHRVHGIDVDSGRALAFDVDFERLRVAVAGEGVIDETALDTSTI